MNEPITLEVVSADQIQPLLKVIQKWRVANYAHFPYLYVSNGADQEDISYYQHSSKLLVVVAKRGSTLEALATAIPFNEFRSQNLDFSASKLFETSLGKGINQYFYISELLFRDSSSFENNEAIGKKLIEKIQSEIKHDSDFNQIAMLIIERPKDHPLRELQFFDESKILKSLGYVKTQLSAKISWNTRISNAVTKKQENNLTLYAKGL